MSGIHIEKFTTHAQYLEDWVLYCTLRDVQNGFYVDVGANDPCNMSVTKAFYDMGWSGINIEPLKDKYNALCEARPRDITLNIGVGAENSFLEFLIANASTTCDPETARMMMASGRDVKKERIAVRKLSEVLEEHLTEQDKTIHFCKIDVEGFERSVLEGMDFHKFRPWVMAIEATIPGTDIPCHSKWEDILFANDYGFGCFHSINRYYFDRLLPQDRIKKIRAGFGEMWKSLSRQESSGPVN